MLKEERLQALWEEIKRRIKSGEMNRPLWAAIDAAHVVTLDGETSPPTLVIGFDAQGYHLSSHLVNPVNQRFVDGILQTVASEPLALRYIEGVTLADYEREKQRDLEAQKVAARESAKLRERRKSKEVVQDVAQEFHRAYNEMPEHHLYLAKAEYFERALQLLTEAEAEIMAVEGEETAAKRRQVDQLIERLARMVELPATLVALELRRRKQDAAETLG